jgi:hypothetical protein
MTAFGYLSVGQQLRLTVDATGRQTRSVVDEIGSTAQDELLLREPVGVDGPGGADVVAGAALHLVWCSPVGQHELPATFIGLAQDRVQLWRVQPDGLVTTTQQREFTRAGDALPATVRRDEQAWPGVVVDLSEGGARCVLEAPTSPPSDVAVLLDVEIDGQVLLLPARVLAASPLSGQRSEVRLAFQSIGRAADVLRRRVLAQQRRARSALR